MSSEPVIDNALNLAKTRLNKSPDFAIYQSIVAQLEYLAAVIDGRELDQSKLKDIIIGHYGAREFEESDPEFADVLMEAQLIATKMQKQ